MFDVIENRIKLLAEEISKSAANHNALIGAMQEASNILEHFKSGATSIEPLMAAAAELSPALEPINTIVEEIANA